MKKLIKSAVVIASVIAGFCVSFAVFANGGNFEKAIYTDTSMTSVVEHKDIDYSINKDGQTYGSGFNVAYIENLPDLISVVGDNGKVGYVYANELLGDAPASPEEAIKIQESIDNGTYIPKVYSVYEADGKTVVDTFTEKTE